MPAIGIMDAALCFESAGLIKYGNKGNMTKEEIDFTCNKLIELKKAGQFPRDLDDIRSVRAVDGGGRGRHSIDVVTGCCRRPREGNSLRLCGGYFKNGKEGYRGWCNGMGLMKHLSGKKLDAAYEYLNWYLSGWQGGFVARYGYLQPGAFDGQEVPDAGRMGLLVRGQAGAGGHQ